MLHFGVESNHHLVLWEAHRAAYFSFTGPDQLWAKHGPDCYQYSTPIWPVDRLGILRVAVSSGVEAGCSRDSRNPALDLENLKLFIQIPQG